MGDGPMGDELQRRFLHEGPARSYIFVFWPFLYFSCFFHYFADSQYNVFFRHATISANNSVNVAVNKKLESFGKQVVAQVAGKPNVKVVKGGSSKGNGKSRSARSSKCSSKSNSKDSSNKQSSKICSTRIA